MNKPLVSVIVPTRNSARLMRGFLASCQRSEYKNFEVIVNDDRRSTDDLKAVVEVFAADGLNVLYLQENTSMAQGRSSGAKHAKGGILVHLDSDMELTPGLLGECVQKIGAGADALIIPEESFGTTFWAKCKWLEKKCYEGVREIESLRCLGRELYQQLGGHNEKMVFSEDKDLDIRVRQAGCRIVRTQNYLRHNEGSPTLGSILRKKAGYSATANIFALEHPREFRWQANVINRYLLFLRNIKFLFRYPVLYIGMIGLKTTEYFAAGVFMINHKIGR